MFCANKLDCGPGVVASRGKAVGAGGWEVWVQVLTSQVQVDNESPCLLCENDLREMKGARAQQRAPFSALLKWDYSGGLAYECTFYFIAFKGHLSQNTNM